jgi:hypothetical protein
MDLQTAPAVTAAPPHRRTATGRALLTLELVLAVGAYAGAVGLLTEAVDLGGGEANLPFGSMVFGGVALLVVNGLLPTAVVVGALRRRPWAELGHVVVGVALIGWIVVQVAFLGWPPHWLQIAYFLYGWVILGLALRRRAEVR